MQAQGRGIRLGEGDRPAGEGVARGPAAADDAVGGDRGARALRAGPPRMRVAPGAQRGPGRPRARPTPAARGPRRVASSAARVVLSSADRPGEGVPAQPGRRCRPGRGPDPPAVRRAACRRCRSPRRRRRRGSGGVRFVGQQPVRSQQTAADVVHHRGPSAASARHGTAEVNPSTRKLLGCTLRMQPVSGPTAAS